MQKKSEKAEEVEGKQTWNSPNKLDEWNFRSPKFHGRRPMEKKTWGENKQFSDTPKG